MTTINERATMLRPISDDDAVDQGRIPFRTRPRHLRSAPSVGRAILVLSIALLVFPLQSKVDAFSRTLVRNSRPLSLAQSARIRGSATIAFILPTIPRRNQSRHPCHPPSRREVETEVQWVPSLLPTTVDDLSNEAIHMNAGTTGTSTTIVTTTPYVEENPATNPDEVKKYTILALLWLTAFLAALDRVAMSVALVPMSSEFKWSSTVKGSISSFFSLGYGLFIVPAGILVGSWSPRFMTMFGVAMWSVATLCTPEAAGMVTVGMLPLFMARALVGAGESIVIPSTQRFLSVWTASDEKSRALAFTFSGFAFGKIGAYALSPLIMDTLGGWRELFYTFSAFGIILLIPWAIFAQDNPSGGVITTTTTTNSAPSAPNKPATLTGTTAVASTVIESPPTGTTSIVTNGALQQTLLVFREAPWRDFLYSKGVWAMLLAHCAKNWQLYTWLTWTPTFYAEQYGISVRDSAWLSILPAVAGIAGNVCAGLLADTASKSSANPDDTAEKTRIRKMFEAVALLGPALSLAVLAWNIPDEAWVSQVFLATTFGLAGFHTAGFETANQEKAGPRWSGLLYSVSSLPGVLMGTLGVYTTGLILDGTGDDWRVVFAVNVIINVLGAISFLALYDSTKEFD